jgi:hypothetical protein
MSAVRAGPDHPKVVHPRGSQRGSQAHAPVTANGFQERPWFTLRHRGYLPRRRTREWIAKQDHPAHIPRLGPRRLVDRPGHDAIPFGFRWPAPARG